MKKMEMGFNEGRARFLERLASKCVQTSLPRKEVAAQAAISMRNEKS